MGEMWLAANEDVTPDPEKWEPRRAVEIEGVLTGVRSNVAAPQRGPNVVYTELCRQPTHTLTIRTDEGTAWTLDPGKLVR